MHRKRDHDYVVTEDPRHRGGRKTTVPAELLDSLLPTKEEIDEILDSHFQSTPSPSTSSAPNQYIPATPSFNTTPHSTSNGYNGSPPPVVGSGNRGGNGLGATGTHIHAIPTYPRPPCSLQSEPSSRRTRDVQLPSFASYFGDLVPPRSEVCAYSYPHNPSIPSSFHEGGSLMRSANARHYMAPVFSPLTSLTTIPSAPIVYPTPSRVASHGYCSQYHYNVHT